MKTKKHVTCCLVLLVAASASSVVQAQQNQGEQRGFTPEKTYQVGDVDSVSLFNGGLTVAVQIGQQYVVSESLSYGLTLSFAGKNWKYHKELFADCEDPPCQEQEMLSVGEPDGLFNSGFGWQLSWGVLIAPDPTAPFTRTNPWDRTHWRYIGPDSGQHFFWDELHDGETDGSSTTWYTRSNNYLRLKQVSASLYTVEFPNGQVHEFSPVGDIWRVTKMEDPFGNSVDISYTNTEWTITDSTGRSHTINFTYHAHMEPYGESGGYMVSSVDLAAAQNQRAVYNFSYATRSIGEGCQSDVLSTFYDVSLLTQVSQPADGPYQMTNPDGSPRYSLDCATDGESGALQGIRLPTRGQIEWDYGVWDMTQNNETTWGDNPPPAQTLTLGVTERRTLTANGTLIGTWEYENELWPFFDDDPEDKPRETRTYVKKPDGSCTTHYHDANPGFLVGAVQTDPGWAYGLPFSEESTKSGGYYLSVEEWNSTSAVSRPFNNRFACSGTALRRSYVDYEHDDLPDLIYATWNANAYQIWHDTNRRLRAQRTVFVDDGNRYSGSVFSDFDGLGHYRNAVTHGNFSSGNVRSTFANYNPGNGSYPSAGYTPPATTDPWILSTFTDRSVTQGATTYKEQFCFESSTGFLERKRTQAGTLSGTGRQAKDLIVEYEPDAVAGNPGGMVRYERYYGGDTQAVSTSSNLCALTLPGAETYQIQRSPTNGYGTVRWVRYDTTGGAWIGVAPVHRDIDPNTGLPDETIADSGLRIDYTYDLLGRPTLLQPDTDHGGARTEYTYTAASGTTPAQVDAVERPNTGGTALTENRVKFDGFGRVIREERRMPDGVWNRRDTEYTARGIVDRVSTTWNGAPTTWTNNTYDQLGRPTAITAPDGNAVVLAYDGIRRVHRTVNVGTDVGVETPQTTTEEYDGQGRLYQVTEPNGTVTTYGYDPADRLISVAMSDGTTTQTRTFNYDGRGFLLSETHPEKTGAVTYSSYDARGHATRKQDGPSDLTLTYDRAERVTKVQETGGIILKEFVYWESNVGTNRLRGKLQKAKRNNRLPGVSGSPTVVIQEVYAYRGLGGQVSERETFRTGNVSLYTTGFEWNGLGLPSKICYPEVCAGGGTEISYNYTRGFLTSVPGYATSISYRRNLLLNTVVHSNGVSDVWDSDPSRILRPSRIRTTGSTATNFDTGTYSYDGSGNITAMGADNFKYDSLSRITAGNAQGAQFSEHNAYDAFGNRVRARVIGPGIDVNRNNPTDPTTNRLLGTASRPIAYNTAGSVTAWGTATYTYDELHMAVRLKDGAENESYVYTGDDERIAIIEANAGNTQTSARWMTRDLDGQVIRTYVEGGFNADPNTWTWEKDYVRREGQTLAKVTPGGTTHAHLDHLGTPRYWTNSAKGPAARHNYLPFGEEVAEGVDLEQLQFTGHERDEHTSGNCGSGTTVVDNQTISTGQQFIGCDAVTSQNTTVTSTDEVRFIAGETIELGNNFVVADGAVFVAEIDGNVISDRQDLDYMHARYCSPYLGRFLTTDPAWGYPGQPQTWNLYAYAAGNPLKYVDPTGETISLSKLTKEQRGELVQALNDFTGNTYDVNKNLELVLVDVGADASSTATDFFNDAIGMDRVFEVTAIEGRSSNGNPETGAIGINFGQVTSAESKRVDLTTFNLGSTLTHELYHTSTGLRDTRDGTLQTPLITQPGLTGPVVDFVNSIRQERGLPTRVNYVAFRSTRDRQTHYFRNVNPERPKKQYKLRRSNP